jgi:signal transduction histidine kinase
LEPVINQRGDHFDMAILNPLGMMHSDANRIRQVLINLLNFSGKVTQPGDISLTAWREPCPEGDWLYLEVKNTANGISKKQLNQLFKLSVMSSTEQDKKALGQEIQLAISKKICELLGGDILAESNPHQGAIFTVCLPCYFQQQTHPVSASA